MRIGTIILVILIGSIMANAETSYHCDSSAGNDASDGMSPQTAWKTLERAGNVEYRAGDRILLKRGSLFTGRLFLKGVQATKDQPVVVDVYGEGDDLPKINSAGYIAGVTIEGCSRVIVQNLEISSDGGDAIDDKAATDRYGVYIAESEHVAIEDLYIHKVFATIQTKSEGKDGTTAYGHGVRIEESSSVRVVGCRIERVGRYGINAIKSGSLDVVNNRTDHTGCSGVQMSRCTGVSIRGNILDHPGSFIDERMHGRGSGSWVWSCQDVVYEKNHFLNASGKADSAGVHIDFNCTNVVVQYCFSMNNAGGFIEILGNNRNCAYRYNISVNDGYRTKGKDGASQEGKTFWLSGFCGGKKPRSGPFNSYIYNNTIYVKEGAPARFSISPSARGALVANNIFHLLGETSVVGGDQKKFKNTKEQASGIVFVNNLYIHDAVLPSALGVKDVSPIVGDAKFRNPGGLSPQDYTPTDAALVKDRGLKITNLPGDDIGLTLGLDVKKDFFGNPVVGAPDLGAIELAK